MRHRETFVALSEDVCPWIEWLCEACAPAATEGAALEPLAAGSLDLRLELPEPLADRAELGE